MKTLRAILLAVLSVVGLALISPAPAEAQWDCMVCQACFGEYSCCTGTQGGMDDCIQQPEFCMTHGDNCFQLALNFSPDGSMNGEPGLFDLLDSESGQRWGLDSAVAGVETASLSPGKTALRKVCNGVILRRMYTEEARESSAALTTRLSI